MLTGQVAFSHGRGEEWIVAEDVVVIEVFVAARDAEDALADELFGGVLDEGLLAVIDEALGEALEQPHAKRDLSQQHETAIGGRAAGVEVDTSSSDALEVKVIIVALGAHRVRPHGVVFLAVPLSVGRVR